MYADHPSSAMKISWESRFISAADDLASGGKHLPSEAGDIARTSVRKGVLDVEGRKSAGPMADDDLPGVWRSAGSCSGARTGGADRHRMISFDTGGQLKRHDWYSGRPKALRAESDGPGNRPGLSGHPHPLLLHFCPLSAASRSLEVFSTPIAVSSLPPQPWDGAWPALGRAHPFPPPFDTRGKTLGLIAGRPRGQEARTRARGRSTHATGPGAKRPRPDLEDEPYSRTHRWSARVPDLSRGPRSET